MGGELWQVEPQTGTTTSYKGDRSLYNLKEGGSEDRVLPIMVHRTTRNTEQGRENFDQVMEIRANFGVNTVRLRRLIDDQDFERSCNDALHVELNACQSEVKDLNQNQVAPQRRVWEAEQQLAKSTVE